jgi:TP901 family phage tail tape measure protein
MSRVGEATIATGVAATAAGAAIFYGLKKAIDIAVEYDKQVRLTYTQVDKRFKPSLIELGEIGRRVAKEIAVPFEEIQPALFDVFSSTEANVKEAEILLREFSKAAVAGQTDVQTASRATIGIMNAFALPVKDVNRVLDIQFQLVQEGVGTYEEWAQRIGLVTPSAVRAGQSVEMMAAALATATRMGTSAARAGTAVARGFDAMSNPKTEAALKNIGIASRDSTGKMRPMIEILGDWKKRLDQLPESKRVAEILDVLKGAGSTIEARRFLQGILLTKGGLELFQSTLSEFEGDAGAFNRAYETMAASTAAKSVLMRNNFMIMAETMGRALMPAWNMLLSGLTKVFDWFNKLPPGTQKVITLFLAFTAGLLVFSGILLVVVGGIGALVAAIGAITAPIAIALAVIAALTVGVGLLAAGFAYLWNKSANFRGIFVDLWNSIQDSWDSLVSSYNSNLKPALENLMNTFQQKVQPVLEKFIGVVRDEMVPRIKEAHRILVELANGAMKRIGDFINAHVIPALERLQGFWEKNESKIRPLISAFAQFAKWMMIIAAVLTGGVILTALTALGVVFAAIVGVIMGVVYALGTLWSWLKQIPAALAAVGTFFTNLWNSIWSGLSTAGSAVLNWFQNLPGMIMSFIQGLPDMLWNLFTSALNRAAYAVGFGFGLVIRFFADFVPKAIGWLISLGPRMVALFVAAWNSSRERTAAGVNAVITFIGGLPARAGAALSQLGPRLFSMFMNAWSRAYNATNSGIARIVSFVGSLPGRIAALAGRMRSAGWDLIMGMINGVMSAAGRLRDAAVNAVKGAIQGAMDALKIGSPSKVFFDMGIFTVQGMINGVRKMAKPLYSTVKAVAKGMPSMGLDFAGQGSFARVGLDSTRRGAFMPPSETTYHQEITINTQEIDPRLHGAQLGFELQNGV